MAETFEEAVHEVVEYFLQDWYEPGEWEEMRPDVEYHITEFIRKYGLDNVHFYIEMRDWLTDGRY